MLKQFIKKSGILFSGSVLGICAALLFSAGAAKANPQFQYLETNKSKEGVVVTKSGLQYRVIKKGTGKKPNADSYVDVHYKGTLIDGTEFDNSYKRGQPASFGLKQVILGWQEGLQLMKEGAKYELVIPYSLGYGLTGGGGGAIPPGATLVFEVELHKVY
ncbi:MAG: FKBP-type peptidyl-prolyl cis-trans isomerase [Methyloligellaceae bacterium]